MICFLRQKRFFSSKRSKPSSLYINRCDELVSIAEVVAHFNRLFKSLIKKLIYFLSRHPNWKTLQPILFVSVQCSRSVFQIFIWIFLVSMTYTVCKPTHCFNHTPNLVLTYSMSMGLIIVFFTEPSFIRPLFNTF